MIMTQARSKRMMLTLRCVVMVEVLPHCSAPIIDGAAAHGHSARVWVTTKKSGKGQGSLTQPSEPIHRRKVSSGFEDKPYPRSMGSAFSPNPVPRLPQSALIHPRSGNRESQNDMTH